jgi:phosphoserine / homoserine phosphotransferase
MINGIAGLRSRPALAALDLEGVLIPEIWSAIAEAFDLPSLARTTREEGDYGLLMRQRLSILADAGLAWGELKPVIARIEPLPGALSFLNSVRGALPVVIVTDGFDLFVREAARSLELDAVLCHRLLLDESGRLVGWEPRIADSKRVAVRSFAGLGYWVRAAGDSLNDLPMLEEAESGFLFRPSEAALDAGAGRYAALETYEELEAALTCET